MEVCDRQAVLLQPSCLIGSQELPFNRVCHRAFVISRL